MAEGEKQPEKKRNITDTPPRGNRSRTDSRRLKGSHRRGGRRVSLKQFATNWLEKGSTPDRELAARWFKGKTTAQRRRVPKPRITRSKTLMGQVGKKSKAKSR